MTLLVRLGFRNHDSLADRFHDVVTLQDAAEDHEYRHDGHGFAK